LLRFARNDDHEFHVNAAQKPARRFVHALLEI